MRENLFRKPDEIAKFYLNEMAVDYGPSYSRLTKKENYKGDMYEAAKDLPIHSELNQRFKTHIKSGDDGSTLFYTLDHQQHTAAHHAHIVKDTTSFPFTAEKQDLVDKDKTNVDLPRGFATSFIYNHFKNSNHPLRSSDEQFHDGHHMWNKLVDNALSDNHHVYYHDKNSGETVKLNDDNKNEYIKKYYGDGDEFSKKHLILSKTPLDFSDKPD